MSLVLPDIILETTLVNTLAFIRADWNANADKTKTALYKLWNGVAHGRYNYYTEAQELFLRDGSEPNKLQVYSYYPSDKVKPPMIVINVPQESTGGVNGLGFDENGNAVTFHDDNLEFQNNYARSFEWTYSISCFAHSRNESNLIYYTLKAFMIALKDHLQIEGLENLRISGTGMQINKEVGAPNFFVRSLNLAGFTQTVVDDITYSPMVQGFSWVQTTTEI